MMRALQNFFTPFFRVEKSNHMWNEPNIGRSLGLVANHSLAAQMW